MKKLYVLADNMLHSKTINKKWRHFCTLITKVVGGLFISLVIFLVFIISPGMVAEDFGYSRSVATYTLATIIFIIVISLGLGIVWVFTDGTKIAYQKLKDYIHNKAQG
jgi:hypothetical protein